MNQYVTGAMIKKLREEKGLTQQAFAELLHVSDKTVSKWETGKGYPDISLLEPITEALHISMVELFSGNDIINTNRHSNMLHAKIYVCPLCGNVIVSAGEALVSCCGITLIPLEAERCGEAEHQESADQGAADREIAEQEAADQEAADQEAADQEAAEHRMRIERIEDEYFVQVDHEMTKTHYITCMIAIGSQRVTVEKLYPESAAQARFKISGTRRILCLCNRHGLFEAEKLPRKS